MRRWIFSLLFAMCLPVAILENKIMPYSELYYYLLSVCESVVFGVGMLVSYLIGGRT